MIFVHKLMRNLHVHIIDDVALPKTSRMVDMVAISAGIQGTVEATELLLFS